MTVADAFKTLLDRIQPLASEIQKAAGYAHTIKRRLEETLALKKFETVGSHSRETAVRKHSDVDYFAILSRDEARWGTGWVSTDTLLKRVRDQLSQRYPQTVVRRDQQAVTVRFLGGEYGVDVVPAIYSGPSQDGWPIYAIPNGGGGWLNTSPPLHGRYIKEADKRSVSKLTRTTQFVKWWRVCRTPQVPMMSFHLEILLAAKEICVGPKSYARCLAETFHLLHERECRPFRDPMKLSGDIPAVTTEFQRKVAMTSVDHALDHASRAIYAEEHGNQAEAWRQWNIVFNDQFPR